MSATTSIQWTEKTWNPVRGCSIVSPGCINCYAMKQAHRFSGPSRPYEGLTKQTKAGPQWTGKVVTVESSLLEPLSWRKPARIFVNSMSDLFHEDVPFAFVDQVFGVMAHASRHTFQILTKRPHLMREYFAVGRADLQDRWDFASDAWTHATVPETWPLPNVWLGVSCENQATADERIPRLLETPAAVQWVSAEPLLGPIDFTRIGTPFGLPVLGRVHWPIDVGVFLQTGIDWVVVGGESGSGARPMDLAWARSLVQQCKAAKVPVFVKQLGALPSASVMDILNLKPAELTSWVKPIPLKDRKGGDPSEWPQDLRVRECPQAEREARLEQMTTHREVRE